MRKTSFRRSPGRRDFINEQPWQVADPTGLDADTRAMADRLGIPHQRMAWLLSCPRCTGNKPHHRGLVAK